MAAGQLGGLFACEECGGEEPFGFFGRAGVGGLFEFDDEWAQRGIVDMTSDFLYCRGIWIRRP